MFVNAKLLLSVQKLRQKG